MESKERYGPWAAIAGASEGTGQSFARQVAAKDFSCVLVAKDGPLEETAEQIRHEPGVETVTATIDLAADDATVQVLAAFGDREVGLYISNAGSDWAAERFLEHDIDDWRVPMTLQQRGWRAWLLSRCIISSWRTTIECSEPLLPPGGRRPSCSKHWSCKAAPTSRKAICSSAGARDRAGHYWP